MNSDRSVTRRRILAAALLTALVAQAGLAAGGALDVGAAPAIPLVASLALVAAAPTLPSARPSAVLGGYAIAVGSGLLLGLTLPSWLALAAAAGIGVWFMLLTRLMHPPAVAAGCLVVAQHAGDALIVSAVVLLGAMLIALGSAIVGDAARSGWTINPSAEPRPPTGSVG
jgi:CBS-domain-containing membrane protein